MQHLSPCISSASRSINQVKLKGGNMLHTDAVCVLCLLIGIACGQNGECPSGQEWDTATRQCTLCLVGYYRSAGEQDRCVRCEYEDTITRRRGAVSEDECDLPLGSRDECPEGTEWISREEKCITCSLGTYRTKGVDYWCVTCPDGKSTASEGSIGPEQCIDGDPECSIGTYWNSTVAFCEPCPIDTFRDTPGSASCHPCPIHHVTLVIGASSSSECIRVPTPASLFSIENCPSGTEPDVSTESCVQCPKDTYRTIGEHARCTPCPRNTHTGIPGAVGAAVCSSSTDLEERVTVCPRGTEWRTYPDPGCYLCPLGTYKDSARRTLCTQCPEGQDTPTPGTMLPPLCGRNTLPSGTQDGVFSADQCPPGTQWAESRGGCVTCPHGYYSTRTSSACIQCPDDLTTRHRGAVASEACNIRWEGNTTNPYFTTDMCPAGSEWASHTRACYACPRGFYRARGVEVCQVCPTGYTTYTAGSTAQTHCTIPLAVPSVIPVSSVGCPDGYQPRVSDSVCEACDLGAYKAGYNTGPCITCPLGTDGPLTTSYRAATSMTQCIGDLIITGIRPSSMLQSVEQEIAIELTAPSGEDWIPIMITVGGQDCRITQRRFIAGTIRCIPKPSRVPLDAGVTVKLTDGRIMSSPVALTHRPDPVLSSVRRRRIFASGGVEIPIEGNYLTSVYSPNLILTRDNIPERTLSVCTVVNNTHLTCTSPDISDWYNRGKRDANTGPDPPIEASLGFDLDGLRLYRDLTEVLPAYSTMEVHRDPVLDDFTGGNKTKFVTAGDSDITLEGSYLNGGTLVEDYDITVGSQNCPVHKHAWDHVICAASNIVQSQLWSLHIVQVAVGTKIKYNPGYVIFIPDEPSTTPSTPPSSTTPNTPPVTDTTIPITIAPDTPPDPRPLPTTIHIPNNTSLEPPLDTTPVDLGRSQDDKKPDANMLLGVLISLGILLLLILILVIAYIRKKRRKRKQENIHRAEVSDENLYKMASSTSGSSQGVANPGSVYEQEETPSKHSELSSRQSELSYGSGEYPYGGYEDWRYEKGNRLSDASLPPLPVESVFGPERRTGGHQRALALPPDGISVRMRDETKSREDMPPEVYVMPQAIIATLPAAEYESMYPTIHL